jgi:hypothetical protein
MIRMVCTGVADNLRAGHHALPEFFRKGGKRSFVYAERAKPGPRKGNRYPPSLRCDGGHGLLSGSHLVQDTAQPGPSLRGIAECQKLVTPVKAGTRVTRMLCVPKTLSALISADGITQPRWTMFSLLRFFLAILASPFKSRSRLEAENAALRHQLIVLRRKVRGRVRLTNNERWFLIQLYRWFPSILQVVTIVQPETLVRWHRAGFRCYWRWKSRLRGGRPQIETVLRTLIRQMSIENSLWGAPRIHGELLKLGFDVAQSRAVGGAGRQAKDGAPF